MMHKKKSMLKRYSSLSQKKKKKKKRKKERKKERKIFICFLEKNRDNISFEKNLREYFNEIYTPSILHC